MQTSSTSIRFLGATRTVTGSRFLVESPDGRILVDCGMYQGERELRRRNWAPFPIPESDVDAVVLSHAHLDHCGWLPRLVRGGYAGPVICSPWTAKVAPIVLRDAAHLQEEDAAHAAKYGYSKHTPPLPLFTTADAEKAISLLRPVPLDEPYELPGGRVTLRRAGHILGSTTVQIQTADASILFSGDLGRDDHPLLKPPAPAPAVDAVVVESTYGDRHHPPRGLDELAEQLRRVFDRGGLVVAPAFAIDRTAVLLMSLRALTRAGKLPVVPVFVDSPMALAALDVYTEAVRDRSEEIRDGVAGDRDPFDPGDLRIARTVEESMRLDHLTGPGIIISAAGMATGGRVVHHLANLAPNPKNLILLPGFQVPGTRGRALLDGAVTLKMFGGYVPVRAEVATVAGLSAHADADGLIAWLRTAPRAPRTCFVVHGDEAPAATLARRLTTELAWCAVVPRHNERVLVQPAKR